MCKRVTLKSSALPGLQIGDSLPLSVGANRGFPIAIG